MTLPSFFLHFENQRLCECTLKCFFFLKILIYFSFELGLIENLHLWHIIFIIMENWVALKSLSSLIILSAHLFCRTSTCRFRRRTHARTPLCFILLLLLYEPLWCVWRPAWCNYVAHEDSLLVLLHPQWTFIWVHPWHKRKMSNSAILRYPSFLSRLVAESYWVRFTRLLCSSNLHLLKVLFPDSAWWVCQNI